MDPQKQRALSRFYREEFERHLDFLRDSGCVAGPARGIADPLCQRLLDNLDRVCCHADFPMLAEALLHNLDLLSGLSRFDTHTGH